MILGFESITLLLLAGFVIGILTTIAGQGGGAFFVPFMTIILLIPIHISIDTSNFIILITSAAGFFTYLRDRRTNLKISLIFSGFAILGCILSTIILVFVKFDDIFLNYLFAFVLLTIGFYLIFISLNEKVKTIQNNTIRQNDIDLTFFNTYDYKKKLKKGIPLFLFAGFVSNLLGIGGGIIIGPVLHLLLGFPIHFATAVSISMVFFTGIVNAISKLIFGNVNLIVGVLIGIGSILGAFIGAKISTKIPKFYLQLIIAIFLVLMSIRMLFK